MLNKFSPKSSPEASAIDLPTSGNTNPWHSLRGSAGSPKPSEKKVTQEDKVVKRRAQCRANQARYRMRQQNRQLQLQQSVQQLREEVDRLKRGVDSTHSGRRTKCNPWVIIAEASRLVGKTFSSPWSELHGEEAASFTAFYQEYFSPDVALGETCGLKSFMEQACRWSTYFDHPDLQLKRVESTAPGVMTATARLSVTVTERSMGSFFPSLKCTRRDDDNDRAELAGRLLGQRLQLNCSITFLLDEETGRVAHLERDVDFVGPLLRVLGSLEDVSSVLRG
ncbi:hypothetical protein PHYSODRAFT_344025 [Phytophthora sojae]|uniref:Bzip transcription factor n=1 Tax=Phytophthora sojae (strain P6497) TaxID=1094619 RepID=G4YQ19_PHYSP|nr:hypothetical protein PHYSODRAFT_344025 [Phytophthora sojae]EGZ29334.1 hypothetical protein PHYSODRAFT_344025 [Phytophthora sojae]|eukprot:XP_009516609.1 hypothetical protein PHYSODRAFT_344025 [Phytophthora sojae]